MTKKGNQEPDLTFALTVRYNGKITGLRNSPFLFFLTTVDDALHIEMSDECFLLKVCARYCI